MRFLSHFSMAVALAAAGTLTITALPSEAQAQKKKKEKKPKLSKEITPQVAAIQKAMAEEDPSPAKPMVEALLAGPWTGYDQFVAGQLAIQLGGKLKDTSLQEQGIKTSLASGQTPAEQAPVFNFYAGNFAYGAERWAEARQYFETAIGLGYRQNNVAALIAESYFKENNLPQGLTALDRAISIEKEANGQASEEWYRRGAGVAMRTNQPALAAEWTYKLAEAYPTGENWRAALSVYRDSAKLDDQQNLELMRLMRKADAMVSERDYFEYADAAGPRKLPGEVVSVLEEGIAKGAVREATSYTKDTLSLARGSISADKASLPASERDASRSANGKIALATGDAYLGYADYQKAVSMYETAIAKGGIDTARAQMGKGIALAGQKDWAGAKQAFSNVTGPRQSVAEFWNLWIDQQSAPAAATAPAAEPSPTAS
ncbi:hypothetical protein SAMN02745824_2531 [Parasphingorhabdus marina DSM 22363]|uniref:Tetratricopeptide repeat-containing protein n=1 Tax=Parasphingorhabdus marina DSM 22363 TaxID=1123272 RepID=A0A1N6FSX4_9SPHN|nr:hypothetical protein [Parasphingorhabdus marina]SIN98353.1 hypothetical protein SAMN02745824_2531 [Parasphingorhabdus marina DSM 22363]